VSPADDDVTSNIVGKKTSEGTVRMPAWWDVSHGGLAMAEKGKYETLNESVLFEVESA
jgi:hypothetical protein